MSEGEGAALRASIPCQGRGGKEVVEALVGLPDAAAAALVAGLELPQAVTLLWDWPVWAHAGQDPPEGEDWAVWVLMAGRGFGKTRAGAEWVSAMARAHPGASIALVAATAEEAREVMIEGRSGLLAAARPDERAAMRWQPARRRLVFASGATAFVYSGADGDKLRGPEHHFAWCDELAKWRQAETTWDNLMLGLRLGDQPRTVVTTTPRSIETLTAILEGGARRTGGATTANPHLSRRAVADMVARHAGTRFGRQELNGEMITDVEGALWTRELIEKRRVEPVAAWTGASPALPLRRVVIGVDPAAGKGAAADACGIVACGLGADGIGYVLADASAAGLSPEGWARRVAETAASWGAQRVVAEKNNGGAMVEAVLRAAERGLPVKLVHASESKAARAEPVATLFERGEAKFAGHFAALEDELRGLTWRGGYRRSGKGGRSPDRADAMVWAMTELMLGPAPKAPGIRFL